MSLLPYRTANKQIFLNSKIDDWISRCILDITTIRISKNTHTELLKIMGQIQAKTGKIPTLDDALKELLENYKRKAKS